jgi:hypothetical protein
LLSLREADREKPIVMSDALAANALNDEAAVIRSHCLAHGQRQFTEIDEVFPEECTRVITDLTRVFKHEAATRDQAMSATERLAYHQTHSGPILDDLKVWLERQFTERRVEPASSLGKAFNYLLNHWPELTRFLAVPGAPIENNTVERALKRMIRQRKNSLCYGPHPQRLCGQPADQLDRHRRPGRNQCADLSGGTAGPSPPGLPKPGGLAALELHRKPRTELSDPAPVLGHVGLVGVAIPQHNRKLPSGQPNARPLGAGPPREAAGGEAFGAQPKPLPIIKQDLDRRGPAVAKPIDRTFQGILGKPLAADGGQPIEATAKIDRFEGQEDPTLRGELQHQAGSRNACIRVTKGRGDCR